MRALIVGAGMGVAMASAMAQAGEKVVIPGPSVTYPSYGGNPYDRVSPARKGKGYRYRDTKSYPDMEKEARKKKIAKASRRKNRSKK